MSNIKNSRWLSVVTIILLIANIATLVLLWTARKHDKPRPAAGPVFEFLTRELALDKQQQESYMTLRNQHQADQHRMQDSIGKAKDAFFELLQQPAVPDSLLQEYSKKAVSYEQQMDLITFRHFQQVRALCTPVQQKKFDELIKEVLHKMAGPRPLHRPPPAGPGEGPGDFPPPPGDGHEPPPHE